MSILLRPRDEGRWTPSRPEGRWCGFGPYYAMFPVEFARRVIEELCPAGGQVLDPFCGRGTTPFVASATGRQALGAEINPVGWIYSAVKVNPARRSRFLASRIDNVLDCVTTEDRESENKFQELAWHPDVLGFLNAARRILEWRTRKVDRTLMGLILIHLHAKAGEGLSNQLRQSKAMAPNYSVRWWSERSMVPPEIDVREFFSRKIAWRYAKGVPALPGRARVRLGDARTALRSITDFQTNLVLTSPPYYDVTNYDYDNWIRLWMLGGPALPSHKHAARHSNQERYRELIRTVFGEVRRLSAENAMLYVRTDAREFSRTVTVEALRHIWPDHKLSCKFDRAPGPTQTALFGHAWNKTGELDLLLVPRRQQVPTQFSLLAA